LLTYFPFSWECSVIGYTLLLSLIEYKTLVMRGDLDRANQILPTIPKEQHNKYVIGYFGLNFLHSLIIHSLLLHFISCCLLCPMNVLLKNIVDMFC